MRQSFILLVKRIIYKKNKLVYTFEIIILARQLYLSYITGELKNYIKHSLKPLYEPLVQS